MPAAVGIVLAAGLSLPAGEIATEVSDLIPGVKDFRMQVIHKAKDEADWPFVAESGVIACAKVLNKPTVYFVPDQTPEATRAFAIDTDLLGMSLVNLGMTNVLKRYGSLEALLKRITPFVIMGRQLCAQPPGTSLTGSEL
ncbi:hypothetical protein [Rhizobium sp. CNPSo 4039]|uniref:hypothetical protein n=1 Tax=Rhizobium sp. CNPSo 4039 TaxID=3021409 RepID=UPI00254B79F3|nr:hypothetical protein [Rhizobium sp. CNPSo 4039]MDK4711209.1 hypothetical protein [Rhizobium sp. CNPSo 4039]